jgi:hypothetical protein
MVSFFRKNYLIRGRAAKFRNFNGTGKFFFHRAQRSLQTISRILPHAEVLAADSVAESQNRTCKGVITVASFGKRFTTVKSAILLVIAGICSWIPSGQAEEKSLEIKPGYSLVVNLIDRAPHTVYSALGRPPEGTIVFQFDVAHQIYTFNQYQKDFWLRPYDVWNPGEGALIYNPSSNAYSVVYAPSEERVPKVPSLMGRLNLVDWTAFPKTDESLEGSAVYRLVGGRWKGYTFDFGDWDPPLPVIPAREAVFYSAASGGSSGSGRGTLLFCNLVPALGLDAPVRYGLAPVWEDLGLMAQLFVVWPGGAKVALTAPVPLAAGGLPGYFDGGLVEIPEATAGQTITVMIRLSTPLLDQLGFPAGESKPISVTLGGGFLPPGILTGLEPIDVIFGVSTQPDFVLSRGTFEAPQKASGTPGAIGGVFPGLSGVPCAQNVVLVHYYRLLARQSGDVVVSTEGSEADTGLAVFALEPGNALANPPLLACNDDQSSSKKTSEVVFSAEAGKIYLIAAGRRDSSTASLTLTYYYRQYSGQVYDVPVPNGSFESPESISFSPKISSWQRNEKPAGWHFGDWAEGFGEKPKGNAAGSAQGKQIARIASEPGAGLFQDYDSIDESGVTHLLDAMFEPGTAFHLTVGVYSDPFGAARQGTLRAGIYYRDESGNRVIIASKTVTNSINTFRNPDQLVDLTVDVPTVKTTDGWAGRHVGIEITSTTALEKRGGEWLVDNVRLKGESGLPLTFLDLGTKLRVLTKAVQGYDYQLQSSSDLNTWVDIGPVASTTMAEEVGQDISLEDSQAQFFRMVARTKH